jgi:hypothetical protein
MKTNKKSPSSKLGSCWDDDTEPGREKRIHKAMIDAIARRKESELDLSRMLKRLRVTETALRTAKRMVLAALEKDARPDDDDVPF